MTKRTRRKITGTIIIVLAKMAYIVSVLAAVVLIFSEPKDPSVALMTFKTLFGMLSIFIAYKCNLSKNMKKFLLGDYHG